LQGGTDALGPFRMARVRIADAMFVGDDGHLSWPAP
jgi:hypothetical protein